MLDFEDFDDPSLRDWAFKHVEETRKNLGRTATREHEELWEDWKEHDWQAFRELCFWRDRAQKRGLSRTDMEILVQRRLKRLSSLRVNGAFYPPPYTFGLEVSVLREALEGAQPRTQVEWIA